MQLTGDADAAQVLWQQALATDDTVEEPLIELEQVRSWLMLAAVADERGGLGQSQSLGQSLSPRARFHQSVYHRLCPHAGRLGGPLAGQPAQALARLAPLLGAARGRPRATVDQMLAIQALALARRRVIAPPRTLSCINCCV
ncbi:MAG: hypothetical protein R2911_41060 [Caldilineaceae bacterium]